MATTANSGTAKTLTVLRAVLMIALGILALFWPARTVEFLVLAGGGLLLVDGVLGFATMRQLPPDSSSRMLGLIRNGLSVLAGLLVLFSSVLLGFLSLGFLTTLVGLLAVLVGIAEFVAGYQDDTVQKRMWPAMVGGAVYIVFGLAVMFLPLSMATWIIRIAAIAALCYGGLLIYLWWQRPSEPPATAA